jgi:pimeloyl-ACP methyl ester carboxylesterase
MARGFSMGDVASETMYQTAQRLARAICVEAGGTPLLLDVFAWRAPYAQRLYAKREQQPSRKSETRRKNRAQASLAA